MRMVHNVNFKLHDRSDVAVEKLIGDCRKYLTSQPGILFSRRGNWRPQVGFQRVEPHQISAADARADASKNLYINRREEIFISFTTE